MVAKRAAKQRRQQPKNGFDPNRHGFAIQDLCPFVAALTVSVIAGWVTVANLRQPWAPLPWLGVVSIWSAYFWPQRFTVQPLRPSAQAFALSPILLVLVSAGLVRLLKISDLPLGPYADEIFTLSNSLKLLHQPFDFFGHTPLVIEGWVETPNLYLYFNLLIVKLFGVSYTGMKLFSVIPGIIACAIFFLIARMLFDSNISLLAALLFAFAHWPVRLSRYGWDVSFMVMMFCLAIWLLLLSLDRGRPLYAFLAGLAAGLSLYSYLGARICLLSLLLYCAAECAWRREPSIFRPAMAFFIGAAAAAYPLLSYYVSHPNSFFVRTAELSVFQGSAPIAEIADNVWRHGLMFFVFGGTYARDNFPGLPMLDPLTALFLIAGLIVLIRNIKAPSSRLIAWIFVVNFAPGIFSVSQEGPPYVYRTAAVMVPTFLTAGMGLQWVIESAQIKWQNIRARVWPVVLVIVGLNLYLYFGLESKNTAAMRVMAYDVRLIGLEIARDDLPVILMGRDILDPVRFEPAGDEKYAYANPPLLLPPLARALAIIVFSGRYNMGQTLEQNLARPKNLFFAEPRLLERGEWKPGRPTKMIFRSNNQEIFNRLRQYYPDATVKNISNLYGEALFSVATLP